MHLRPPPWRLRSSARVPGSILLCLLVSTLAGCGGSEREAAAASPPEAVQPTPKLPAFEAPKNLLFVILDAFNADHAGYVGYSRDTTPHLDELARSGVGFTRAHSQSANTLSSSISYFIGRYPPRHVEGGSKANLQLAIAPDDYPLAEAFADAGYRTAAFTENPWISRRLGFGRGFDVLQLVRPTERTGKSRGPRRRIPGATAKLFSLARAWIGERGDEPWFCYLHAVRPHNPYEAPAPFAARYSAHAVGDAGLLEERDALSRCGVMGLEGEGGAAPVLTDRYDENVAYADHLVGELVDWLREEGIADDTLVIVASDHGEAFGQHRRCLHNHSVYEEMIHVPLVMLAPASLGVTPRLIDTPVEMVDLYPTLVQIFSLRPRRPLDGKSLAPLLFQVETEHKQDLFSQTQRAEQIAVRRGTRKLILDRRGSSEFVPVELYDLAADPGETRNRFSPSAPPADLLELAEWYRTERYLRPPGAVGELDDSQREMLRTLGYLRDEGDAQ